jgi:hypothetical protein
MVQKSAPTEAQRRNGTFLAILERHNGTSLRCSAIRRTGEPTTRAAAPNQALHVGIFGMAGRGGAAECQLDCCSARIAFSQSTISEIESFGATFGAVRAAFLHQKSYPVRDGKVPLRCAVTTSCAAKTCQTALSISSSRLFQFCKNTAFAASHRTMNKAVCH